jgi:hypothetical protein
MCGAQSELVCNLIAQEMDHTDAMLPLDEASALEAGGKTRRCRMNDSSAGLLIAHHRTSWRARP